METKVLLDPKEYPALLEEIREKYECKLVFDDHGRPHREDYPEIYPRWLIQSLEDLVVVLELLED